MHTGWSENTWQRHVREMRCIAMSGEGEKEREGGREEENKNNSALHKLAENLPYV